MIEAVQTLMCLDQMEDCRLLELFALHQNMRLEFSEIPFSMIELQANH